MSMLYDYRPLNTASATSEGPIATFEPIINLNEDLPPLFVADDVDYDNYSVAPEDQNVFVPMGSFFRASNDAGATFQPAIALDGVTWGGTGPLVASTGNHVYVAAIMVMGDDRRLFFQASHDSGATFDAAIDLGQIGGVIDGVPYDGQLVISGPNVYLTWILVKAINEHGLVDGHFYFVASHDYGVTFDPVISLLSFDDFGILYGGLQKIAAYGNDVYVVFNGNLLAKSNDNGVTFDPIIDLGFSPSDIAVSGSNVYLLFARTDLAIAEDPILFLSVSHDGGSTFSPPIDLGGTFFKRSDTDLLRMVVRTAASEPSQQEGSSNSDDEVYIAWHTINRTDDTESLLLTASHDGGATFEDPITLAGDFTDNPKIAVSGTEVYVIFRSFVSDGYKIFFTMSSDRGATFGPLTEVVASAEFLNVPKLAVSSFTNADSEKVDNIFVTWQETNRGESIGDVFFRAARFLPLPYDLNLFEGTSPSDLTLDLGQEVKAVASTSDPSVTQVNFTWNNPDGDPVHTELVSLSLTGQAEDTFTPDKAGQLTIVADFGNGEAIQQTLDIRLFVIPESPLGTLALIASSMAALTLYGMRGLHHRRKQRK